MARRRIRQSELARLLGCNDQWLSVRLRGIVSLNLDEIDRIAGVLGVKASELLVTVR
jgi:transcriptional regulator with XRE-family HTH domain